MAKVDYWLNPDNLILITAWKRCDMTNDEIAKKMKISRSTLNIWANKHEKIKEALKGNSEIYNRKVEKRLHELAEGFMIEKKKPIKVKRTIYNEKGQRTEEIEEVVMAVEEEYVKPDVRAMQFWLTNRSPADWSSSYAQIEQKEETSAVVVLEERVRKNYEKSKNSLDSATKTKRDAISK